jgi:site-specific DNA-adenine methylase
MEGARMGEMVKMSDIRQSPNLEEKFQFPCFRYLGGKGKQALTICSAAPPAGEIFADVFCGLGNVFWPATSMLRYERWWINDIRTAEFFHAVARVGNTVKVPDRSQAKKLYDFYKARRHDEGYRDDAIVLASYLSRNGGGYDKWGARTGGGVGPLTYARNLHQAYAIMHRTNPLVTNWDYERVFQHLGPADFAFVDPPYLGANVGSYGASDLDHTRLVIALKYARFPWLLCEYKHRIYLRSFGEPFWEREVHCYAHPHAGRRIECMWKNF